MISLTPPPPPPPFLSHRTMAITMSNNQQSSSSNYWTSLNQEIDAHLKQAIPLRPPLSVYEPMHHLTFSAPRTPAPALCIAACELVGGHRDQALPAASALRLMHAAAFTHEQLPALKDRPRPGRPPNYTHKFEPNIELLTGDGLVPFGMELLASSDDPAQEMLDRILRVIVEITRAMGSQGFVEGQYKESQYGGIDGEEAVQVAWIGEVCKKKEGELHACAGACGAILGGGSDEEVEKLRRYGLYVGTIRGIDIISGGVESKDEKLLLLEEVNKLRNLAVEELRGFDQGKVEKISSIIDNECCNV
ncbi:hypothetical protein Tsubulata_002329 [Turnera subulata]|uniref:Uncharacterized protein n=1 Tax=Turnera subulata TaxID=218843 RepID=A0A9Q0JKS7_9ROSI|nr:hypothetical protein Tsubulata_002329 [Turnera subulata]